MTADAAELLEQSLTETRLAADLPEVDELLDAFEELIDRQEDVYDHILLPRLGLGERFDVRAHELACARGFAELSGGEIWLFDRRAHQSWLHAPLLLPFQDLDDTLILVRRADVPAEVAARLRPPMVPGVRRALGALDWLVVDTGGYEGGRMQHDEFLDEIGERPWYRIDHDPQTGAARFEQWRGEEPQGGWSANVFDAFECQLQPDSSWESPAVVARPWPDDLLDRPFAAALSLDLLDDPYAILRRLLCHDAGLDIDRLGPLVNWKDHPDVLFEFTDAEDSLLADAGAWMADAVDADADDLGEVVDDWFGRMVDAAPVDLPGLGELHDVAVPPVDLLRPRPLMGHRRQPTAHLDTDHVLAATSRPAERWLDNLTAKH